MSCLLLGQWFHGCIRVTRDCIGVCAQFVRSVIKATVRGAQINAAYDLYEARIQGYQKNPPPEDCNGAFALPTK